MVAEEYLGRSRLFRRLKNGPHGQLVELYAARLVKDELARHGTWRCLNLVSGLLIWIAKSRSTLSDLDERMVEQYLQCHIALKSKNAPVGARYCSKFENLLEQNYQICCNNDNAAGSGGMPSMAHGEFAEARAVLADHFRHGGQECVR